MKQIFIHVFISLVMFVKLQKRIKIIICYGGILVMVGLEIDIYEIIRFQMGQSNNVE